VGAALGLQMKHRISTARPYGKWLADQTATLADIVNSVPPEQRVAPPIVPAVAAVGASGNGASGNGASPNGAGASSANNGAGGEVRREARC
jgi:hypothetical protein